MKISVVLLFVFVVLEAHYYDRDKTPSCQFPCPWRGRTFDLWEFGKSKPSLYAKVSMDGRTMKWSFGKTTECYQILAGFLVLRLKGEDNWFCTKIIYNKTKRPTTFKIHSGSVGDFVGKQDAFKICEICPYPGKKFYTAVGYGYQRRPKQTRKFGCNVPKGCKCCTFTQCGRCRKCKGNGNIPNACSSDCSF